MRVWPGRILGAGLCLLVLAACTEEKAVTVAGPAAFENPAFDGDGALTGVRGISAADWALVDGDFRRALFWQLFLEKLTDRCRLLFPEHDAWLTEFAGVVHRGTGAAVDQGLLFERARLGKLGEGGKHAIVGLDAMRAASMDVEGLLILWYGDYGPRDLDRRTALVAGCDLLIGGSGRRDMLRTIAAPLQVFYDRIRTEMPEVYRTATDVDALFRRLGSI
ncbi:MAG: hypothetical protein VYB54_08800 [Pseudomonadota bacterium]|nr:hypothetical protein [Pseudomonadota bacterium]